MKTKSGARTTNIYIIYLFFFSESFILFYFLGVVWSLDLLVRGWSSIKELFCPDSLEQRFVLCLGCPRHDGVGIGIGVGYTRVGQDKIFPAFVHLVIDTRLFGIHTGAAVAALWMLGLAISGHKE